MTNFMGFGSHQTLYADLFSRCSDDRQQGWGPKTRNASSLERAKRLWGQGHLDDLRATGFSHAHYSLPLWSISVRPREITQRLAKRHGVVTLRFVANRRCGETRVKTSKGWLSFQKFFCARALSMDVIDIEYSRLFENARTRLQTPGPNCD